MANVILIGLEEAIATQISQALAAERHRIEQKTARDIEALPLKAGDIVFAGGRPAEYLPLLRRVRRERPALPFVVVSRFPGTKEWLDALEAGATDYCPAPFKSRQIRRLMESALPGRGHIGAQAAAAAAR
jgi:DNA-binding NtrC family response regulator